MKSFIEFLWKQHGKVMKGIYAIVALALLCIPTAMVLNAITAPEVVEASGANFNDVDHLPQVIKTVTVIDDISDFPAPVGGFIIPENGYYFIDGKIEFGALKLKIPDDSDITIDGSDNNQSIFNYTGGADFISDNAAVAGASAREFRMQFMQIEMENGGTAFNFPDAGVRRNTFWLKGTFVTGADQIGILENFDFFSLTDYPILSGFLDGFKLGDIGQTTVITQAKFANPSATGTFLDFDNGTFSSVSMSNSLFDPPAGLSIVNFNPTATFSQLVLISGNSYDPVNGGEFWETGLTGDISAYADAGGGQVTVTSTAHGMSNGDDIEINESDNYDGGYEIANVLANSFEITHSFDGDDAKGVFDSGSMVQDNVKFVVDGNSYIEDSSAFTFCAFNGNALTTTISAINTPAKVNALWDLAGSERFVALPDGRVTYVGLESITVDVTTLLTAEPTTGGSLLSTVYIFKNGAEFPLAQGDAEIKAGVQIGAFGLIPLVTGDFLEIFIENNTNGNNIDVVSGGIKVT